MGEARAEIDASGVVRATFCCCFIVWSWLGECPCSATSFVKEVMTIVGEARAEIDPSGVVRATFCCFYCLAMVGRVPSFG